MNITIQRDSRIFLKEHGEEGRFVDPLDPLAIMAVMRAHTQFEEGLTLRQLLKALRPWKDMLGRTAWMNFDTWFEQADKTFLREVSHDSEAEPDALGQLEIYNVLSLSRDEEGLSISTYWDFRARYRQPQIIDGRLCETCSVTFSPTHEYANLPIIIDHKARVIDRQSGHLGGRRPILHTTLPGVYSHIETPAAFFDVVVLGLLDSLSFHGDPDDTNEVGDELREAAASIERMTNHDISEDGDEIDPGVPLIGLETTTMEEFWEEMGLGEIGRRNEAAIALGNAVNDLKLPNPELAGKLGLTDLGLDELKAGINAQFSLETLERMTKTITQFKNSPEPTMTFKQAYLAAIQDPISSVMAVVGRSYRYKTILVPACLIGVVGFLLSVCFTITALGVRNNAWQLLFQGTVGCLVGGNLALMCAAFARQSPDKVKSWLQ